MGPQQRGHTGTESTQGSAVPELFHLIERGEWVQVSERCKTHPREARVWVKLKKAAGSGYDTPGPPEDVELITVGNDSSANRSLGTVASSKSNGSANSTATHIIKCQPLHHACQRLRSVHGRIQRTLAYLEDAIVGSMNPPSPNINCSSLRARSRTVSTDTDGLGGLLSNNNLYPVASSTTYPDPTTTTTQSWHNEAILLDSSSLTHPTESAYNNIVAHDNIPIHEDPWIEACKAILALIEAHPEAAQLRESRHGCLPLHLAVFSMCPTPLPSPSV